MDWENDFAVSEREVIDIKIRKNEYDKVTDDCETVIFLLYLLLDFTLKQGYTLLSRN